MNTIKKALGKGHRIISGLLKNKNRQKALEEIISGFPTSNGIRYYDRFPYKVGIVADEFIFKSFEDTCDLIYLRSSIHEEELLGRIDLLLVVSTWRGLYDDWIGVGKEGTPNNIHLHSVMQFCRNNGIPVAFYSKEDPPNFEYFLNLGTDSDVIFTSAQEMISEYKLVYPGKSIYTLPFGFNSRLYNPIGMKIRMTNENAVFAGSWITKYPDRIDMQRRFFRWIRKAGLRLSIIDRNDNRPGLQYQYPLHLQPYTFKALPYEQIAAVFKVHDWVINFNSVSNSETMYAMRICEAMACGSLIWSNASTGMESQFPEVFCIKSKRELLDSLKIPMNQQLQRRLRSIRNVFRHHTTFDRMGDILSKVGFQASVNSRRVAVVIDPKTLNRDQVIQMFNQQSYQNRFLIEPDTKNDEENYDIITTWTDGKDYGEFYLENMVNGFKYTNCDYITCNEGQAFEYAEHYQDKYYTLFWNGGLSIQDAVKLPVSGDLQNGFSVFVGK